MTLVTTLMRFLQLVPGADYEFLNGKEILLNNKYLNAVASEGLVGALFQASKDEGCG